MAREEGKEEGIEIGLDIGLEKGLKVGDKKAIIMRDEGREEGERKKALDVAKTLKKANTDIALIIEATGLTKKEIESL